MRNSTTTATWMIASTTALLTLSAVSVMAGNGRGNTRSTPSPEVSLPESEEQVTTDRYRQFDMGTFCLNDAACDDGNVCTDDSCSNGQCLNTANTLPCDDGLFCTATGLCSNSACVGSGDTCPARTCDEATQTCGPVTGAGLLFSRDPDFSTDDVTFIKNETLHILAWHNRVNFNAIADRTWKFIERPAGPRAPKSITGKFTNHFDGTYTASIDLSQVPSLVTDWTFIANIHDRTGTEILSWVEFIQVLPQCMLNSQCDDGIFCNGRETCDGRRQVCVPGKHPCPPGESCDEQGAFCFVPVCPDTVCDAPEDACNCPEDCGAPPATETDCADGMDNDCDRLVDCNDDDCARDPACPDCLPSGAACNTDADCCNSLCTPKKGRMMCD